MSACFLMMSSFIEERRECFRSRTVGFPAHSLLPAGHFKKSIYFKQKNLAE